MLWDALSPEHAYAPRAGGRGAARCMQRSEETACTCAMLLLLLLYAYARRRRTTVSRPRGGLRLVRPLKTRAHRIVYLTDFPLQNQKRETS